MVLISFDQFGIFTKELIGDSFTDRYKKKLVES